MQSLHENAKTKPTVRLTPRQLAAARLLAKGRHPRAISQQLGIHRVTLWRWLQQPAFEKEVYHAHELLAMPGPATRPPGRVPFRPASDAELDPETAALLNSVLARAGVG